MVTSAYIHIPFCKSKCHYCSFISFCCLDKKEEYLAALEQEIKTLYENEPLKTLYIGGGTPSVLNPAELQKITGYFNITPQTEITTELNPEDIDFDYLRELFDTGINRLSFGCQTFNDEILKQINRRHNSQKVKEVIFAAKRAGFKNISLDFIYGLPNQTTEMFKDDLKRGIDLGLEHISLYGLKIENGCYFSQNTPENLPDDDTQADMYLEAVNLLKEHHFKHYEVSNFAHEGFESRHNLNYWNNSEYYGFGTAAHGYKNGVRYENKTTLDEYIAKPCEKAVSHILTTQEKLEEEIFLGLRKMDGINTAEINSKYGIEFEIKYKDILAKYTGLKLLEKTSNGYKFTENGILVSNPVLADFLE